MFQPPPPEQLRYEDPRHKHDPPPPRVAWAAVVKGTGEPGEPSRFRQGLAPDQIVALCLRCVREGIPVDLKREHEGGFYLETDEMIGACAGEETSIVYALCYATGTMHGYPMSRTELKRRFGL